MIRAEYDSQADALSIDLAEADGWDDSLVIDDSACRVALSGGVPVNVELLAPTSNLHLLAEAARVLGIEQSRLEAAAGSALAAPDTVVSLTFSAPAGSSDPGR